MNLKTLMERGRLIVSQRLAGDWTLEALDTENEIKPNPKRLTVNNPYLLTEEQMREVCSIVNSHNDKKKEFIKTLRGIRCVAEATKDAIPMESHIAIDMLLYLIDEKISEYEKPEKENE